MAKNLILLHGALGSKTQFESLKLLIPPPFVVYDLNFEGHGGRPGDNEFSMDVFADNILEVFRKNKLTKANLFGYSMGGYAALKFAFTYPNLVDKIITLGTKFAWTKEVAEKEVKMLNPEKIKEKVPAFAEALAKRHYPNDWQSVLNKTAKMMLALAKGENLKEEQIKRIQHEVIIGIGSLDNMVTIEESEHVTNLLPNGVLEIIEGFKHPIEKVDMERLSTIILRFLKGTP